MNVRMRIDGITLLTEAKQYSFDLSGPCTILHGPVGTGKSSLLELIKHAFGGNAVLTKVVRNEIQRVDLSVNLAGNRLVLRRGVGMTGSSFPFIDVIDPRDDGVVRKLPVRPRPNQETISDLLLETLGLPRATMPRARTKATSATVPLTFNDLYTYLYVEQQEIDRSVVHHTEVFREPKRRAIFELIFGLADADQLRLETELGRARDDLKGSQQRLATIRQFIETTAIQSESELRQQQVEFAAAAKQAEDSLERLRAEIRSSTGAFEGLRRLVQQAETAYRSALETAAKLAEEVTRREHLLALHNVEAAREDKARSASRRFAALEFVVCPRCMQAIEEDRANPGTCHLCLQPEAASPVADAETSLDSEDQAEELELLLNEAARDAATARTSATNAENELRMLKSQLDESTATAVAPRFQEIELLASAKERAIAQQQLVMQHLGLWREVETLNATTLELESRQAELTNELSAIRRKKEARRSVLDDLSGLFSDTVAALEVPWAQYASIDPNTFLPTINGEKFDTIAVAGGTKTIVNVAYHLTLLGYALAQGDTLLPQLLVIDTPRKNLGANPNDREMGSRIYRRIRTLVDAYRNDVQFVVADNDVPEDADWFKAYRFSYEQPLLPHVLHPGEEAALSGQLETVESIRSKA